MAFTYLDLQRFLVAKRHHRLHPAERPSRNAAGSELRRYSAGLKLLLAFRRQREGSTHVRRALEMHGSDRRHSYAVFWHSTYSSRVVDAAGKFAAHVKRVPW